MLAAFLAFEFDGVKELRAQARSVLVAGTCGCGCGTVYLQPVGDQLPRSSAASPIEITGDVRDTEGNRVGGVILLVHDGLLSSLEVYTFTGRPLAIPSPAMITWRR